MDINKFPDEFKAEEQRVLYGLIQKMDKLGSRLDERMREYVEEAKKANTGLNPDTYATIVAARRGIKETEENKKTYNAARDELYKIRLLLKVSDSDVQPATIEEYKVGLHGCQDKDKILVASWLQPVFRNFVFNEGLTEYTYPHEIDNHIYTTKYKLIVKNNIALRFTKVVQALNVFPGAFDEEVLEAIRNSHFFSDSFLDDMIGRFDPDSYDPDSAAKIIADEFLQELLERRTNTEFRNIVFSIQKKQGEIIQVPFDKNIIVQGCAGSGKSMIMMHRLPIVLYDNPSSLKRSNLYIITPSPMYIQLSESMRHELEITDLKMGTLREYYDYCIQKYFYSPSDYGRIKRNLSLPPETIQYIYSEQCIMDICDFFDKINNENKEIITKTKQRVHSETIYTRDLRQDTYMRALTVKANDVQNILTANNSAMKGLFNILTDITDVLQNIQSYLESSQNMILRSISKKISDEEDTIAYLMKELGRIDKDKREIAYKNRSNLIEKSRERLVGYQNERKQVEADTEYFSTNIAVAEKISSLLLSCKKTNKEFEKNPLEDVYAFIECSDLLIQTFDGIQSETAEINVKYADYIEEISVYINKLEESISRLKDYNEEYLDIEEYKIIKSCGDQASHALKTAVRSAYCSIMEKVGISKTVDSKMYGAEFSPYLYLQVLYQFSGAPSGEKESLIAVDEAQNINIMEFILLKNVNGKNVVFNLYGDERQYIEGSKGMPNWEAVQAELGCDKYIMNENYRNASQITEYCNKAFHMEMIPINTVGRGVHELSSSEDMIEECRKRLASPRETGLSAVIVKNESEAQYILEHLKNYKDRIHDLTREEFSIHRNRWNIISVDECKGLEFSFVVAITGRMTQNEKYIACTRALNELCVLDSIMDVSEYEKKKITKDTVTKKEIHSEPSDNSSHSRKKKNIIVVKNTPENLRSKVSQYILDLGLEVLDNRNSGGLLWIIGERAEIEPYVSEVCSKFGISGKYMSSKESGFRNGWCTKTKK